MGPNHKLCFSGSITIIHLCYYSYLVNYCVNEWLVWINWIEIEIELNWNWIESYLKTATILHFCQKNLYSCFSIIILPICININLFCHCVNIFSKSSVSYWLLCLFFKSQTDISSIPCKNMCKNFIKVPQCVN